METINDRMQQIADVFCGGNKAAFAKAIGIAPTSITNYLGKQRASKPSSDLLEKIVNSLEVDAMWLLTGTGEMKRKTTIYSEKDMEIQALKQEIAELKAIKHPQQSERILDVFMKFMEVSKEMAAIYNQVKGE